MDHRRRCKAEPEQESRGGGAARIDLGHHLRLTGLVGKPQHPFGRLPERDRIGPGILLAAVEKGRDRAVGQKGDAADPENPFLVAHGERANPPGRQFAGMLVDVGLRGRPDRDAHAALPIAGLSLVATVTTAPSTVQGRGAEARRQSRASVSHSPGNSIACSSNMS